jgi:4-amino-4-deoxy-L-arabinose transferase-like glycosyltransferase
VIILVLTAAVRIRLLNVPLERDEGAYAYMGQLILAGVPPYTQSYDVKMPGLYATYAMIMAIFGQTRAGIHLGLLLANAATILLLFLMAKRLCGNVGGIVTAAIFASLSVSQMVQGVFANAEHFVILPSIAGFVFLLRADRLNRLVSIFLSGVLLGAGFVIKQPGAAFVACGGLYLLYSQVRIRPRCWSRSLLRCLLFGLGAVLPFGFSCLLLWATGVFHEFWFWTYTYPAEYVSSVPLSEGLENLQFRSYRMIKPTYLLWIAVGIGLSALLWNGKTRSNAPFVIMFALFSFLSVCPGLYFWPHYFVLLLPAASLLAGIAVSSTTELLARGDSVKLRKVVPTLLVLVALGQWVYNEREYLFQMSPEQVSRDTYGANPFVESLVIAEYIRQNTSANDSIAVLGSESQICFYAQRRSASRHTSVYPIVALHKYAREMQQEVIQDIESARPRFLVFVNVPASWSLKPQSIKDIFRWFDTYTKEFYEIAGIVDIVSLNQTIYLWDDKVIGYYPRSNVWLGVFRRKEGR